MNLRVTRGACALLAAAALTAGTTSAASAATWSHTDAKGDVVATDVSASTPTTSPAPDNQNTDVTALRVAHNKSAVVVRVTTRATMTKQSSFGVYLKTADGLFLVMTSRMMGAPMYLDGNHPKATCEGIKVARDSVRHRIQTTIPRSCLGTPHWVKIAARTSSFSSTGTMYEDDANTSKAPAAPVFSPKIVVG